MQNSALLRLKLGTPQRYCLLYNVPTEKLTTSYKNCVVNTLNWYRQETLKAALVRANEQYYLLRDGYHTCWREADCDAFVEAAVKLWNEW